MKTRYSLIALGALLALSQAALAQRGSSGHVNVIYWQAPSILNPYLSGGTKDLEASSLILDPLVKFNEKGEMVKRGASGLLAQIFQHECDHLSGVLFTEKANELWEMTAEEIAELQGNG